jgi:hydrogenase maturation protein HypF
MARVGAAVRVRGQVQGVGFRPFVWALARRLGLAGEVLNDAEGVLARVAGPAAAVDAFVAALAAEAPPLARVDAVARAALDPAGLPEPFVIAPSAPGAARTPVTPDAATCPDCRAEIAEPAARRFGYAFTNCTRCGPRYTIVERVPYDRAATTMRGFPMCEACAAEYADPADRRFHAQPIACPACGPRLWLERGAAREDAEPIRAAAALLRAGMIVAVKGLGGFHLAVDARDEAAVARLRARKRRPSKPFALMAADLAAVRAHARASDAEAALLSGPEAPIVLLEAAGAPLAPSVAPGQWALGWMLPSTPLHHLLLGAFGGPLVMTSGNLSGEPQAVENAEARAKLAAFADAFLMHDRPIARRLDDSVARVAAGRARLIRRARGHAPATRPLPEGFAAAPPALAYGGELKAALCLTREGRWLLSHHLGDLDDALTHAEFLTAEADGAALFDHAPARLACDLHPDWRATRRAEARAAAEGLPLARVQHHHAHVAAAMAEALWPADGPPVVGVALDGLGWGPDGTVWGGEILLCRYDRFERLARLAPAPLPGGGAAQAEPWRNLWARLVAAGIDPAPLLPGRPLATLAAMVARRVNAPLSSSAGRLFDAVACAAGLAPDRLSHEGEAAMALETAARRAPEGFGRPYAFADRGDLIDPAPIWADLLADRADPGLVAARFHAGLAAAVADRARAEARRRGAGAVALTGGVFQNVALLGLCLDRLDGLTVLVPAEAPANDGGLALGQAAVALAGGGG